MRWIIVFVLVWGGPVHSLVAQDDWRAKIVDGAVRVSSAQGWAVLETIPLPWPEAWKIVPSPGGKVVFVLHRGIPGLTLIDGETRRVRGRVSLPGVPEDLWFSETGFEVGIAWADSRETSAFRHRQGALEATEAPPPPRPAPSGPEAVVRLHPDEGFACF